MFGLVNDRRPRRNTMRLIPKSVGMTKRMRRRISRRRDL
jgi:hypothetical protein